MTCSQRFAINLYCFPTKGLYRISHSVLITFILGFLYLYKRCFVCPNYRNPFLSSVSNQFNNSYLLCWIRQPIVVLFCFPIARVSNGKTFVFIFIGLPSDSS